MDSRRRGVKGGPGFNIPVMPQGAFYVFADDSYQFAFDLLEKAGVGVAPGVDVGLAGKRAVRFSDANSEENIREAARRLRSPTRRSDKLNDTGEYMYKDPDWKDR